jgi:hypothetical protein
MFLRFSTNFTRFNQTVLLLKFPLYTGVPGLFYRFTTMPSVHTKHLGKKEGDAMWSLGMEGGAVRRNWAAFAAPLAREEVGEDEELTVARFVAGDGAVRPPVREDGGGWRRLPLELLLRRGGGADSATNGTRRWCGAV